MVSVADELIFEQLLESLPPHQRASVDRVLTMRGYGQPQCSFEFCCLPDEVENAAYQRGLADGRAEQKNAPA